MLELVFLSGARAGVVVPVSTELVAGRDSECNLELPDPRVSRLHARFVWDGTTCQVVDANSSNGTFVNEKQVKQADLKVGDVVRLGGTRLRLRAPSRTKGASRPRTSVFGIRETAIPEMAHSVSLSEVDQASTGDPSSLQHRLAKVIHVSELLATARNLDDLYEPVLDSLFGLFPQTDRAFLMLGDRVENLDPRAMRQSQPSAPGQLVVSSTICRHALEKGEAIVYREGESAPIDPSMSMIDLSIRSAIAVPLMIREEVLGMVVLDSRDTRRTYTQADLELAASVCHQVAVAIKNAKLRDEVEHQTAERNNLMRFLPQAMAEQVMAGEIDAGLGGRRYGGTVLFSDLVGFTRRAEFMKPDSLITLLNGFFNAVVPCIEAEDGSVDKFMGDAIMAVWGIPIETGDSDARAVAASLAMQTNLTAFNSMRQPPLHMGIGINSGEVLAGNIGIETRREYTVLGDAVNTAQRIGAAACLEQSLIGETGWERLVDQAFAVRMPTLLAKNKTDPVQCYSVRGLRQGQEIQLFLPIRVGEGHGWLIRRLEDQSFILLHEPGELTALRTCAVELPGLDLGVPIEHAQLPSEAGDGMLRRLRIELPDPLLGGLLSDTTLDCALAWEEMDRTKTSLERS